MSLFPLELNKKITIAIATLAALGLIALAAWMWSQAIEPALEKNVSQQGAGASDDINTSDWETYRNEEWGFEVRYPKNNFEKKLVANSIIFTKDCSEFQNNSTEYLECSYSGLLTISITDKDLNSFIEEYKDDCTEGQCLTFIQEQEPYTVAGVRAQKLTGTSALGWNSYYVFINHQENNYLISYDSMSSTHRHIIDSFKFLD